MHDPQAAAPTPRRGAARRLGLHRPPPPMRIAKITGAGQRGDLYAVAGVNGRSWIEDTGRRVVHKPLVVIKPGMIRDTRSPFSPWIKVRGTA